MRTILNLVLLCQLIFVINAFTVIRFPYLLEYENAEETTENSVTEETHQFLGAFEPVTSAPSKSEVDKLDKIESDLSEIKEVLIENKEDAFERQLPEDCVEAIRSRNMKLAYSLLEKIDDPTKINWIVKEVYNNNYGNYDLILEFIDATDEIRKKLPTFEALTYELLHSNTSTDYVIKLRKKLLNLKSLYPEDEDLVDNTLFKMNIYISKSYKSVLGISQSLDAIKKDNQLDISILAYEYLYEDISNDVEGTTHVSELAYALKQAIENPDYVKLKAVYHERAEKLKNSFPSCVKNTMFNDKVYIKNVQYNEYLYSSKELTNLDTWRLIYSKPSKAVWSVKVSSDGKSVAFRNEYNEYLYSKPPWVNAWHHVESQSEVYSYVPQDLNRDGYWILETVDDNCYIKNSANNARLFVSNENHLLSSQANKDGDDFLFRIQPIDPTEITAIDFESELFQKLDPECLEYIKMAYNAKGIFGADNWVKKHVVDFFADNKFCSNVLNIVVVYRMYQKLYDAFIIDNDDVDYDETLIKIVNKLKSSTISDFVYTTQYSDRAIYCFQNEYLDTLNENDDDEEFLDNLNSLQLDNDWKIVGYEKVFERIMKKDNSHLLTKLAYFLKKIENDEQNDPKLTIFMLHIFKRLKESLPSCIQTAVFNDYVKIKNVKYNKYLHASTVIANSGHWRLISLSRNENSWAVSVVDNGKMVGFRDEYGEYLYSKPPWVTHLDDSHVTIGYMGQNQPAIEVYAYTPKELNPDGYWVIEPNGENCYLRNNINSARIFATDTDTNHWVYSQKSSPNDDSFLFTIEKLEEASSTETATSDLDLTTVSDLYRTTVSNLDLTTDANLDLTTIVNAVTVADLDESTSANFESSTTNFPSYYPSYKTPDYPIKTNEFSDEYEIADSNESELDEPVEILKPKYDFNWEYDYFYEFR